MTRRSSGQHLSPLRGPEVAALSSADMPQTPRGVLESAISHLPASGVALLRPCLGTASPWRVDYAGRRKGEMGRWIQERLEPSLEASARHLTDRAPCSAGPSLILTLHREGIAAGLCVLWPREGAEPGGAELGEAVEGLREALEVVLEVEHGEETYFGGPAGMLDAELARSLGRGDVQALPALLSLVRTVGGADIAYWGSVRGEVVEWSVTSGPGTAGSGSGSRSARA